MRALWLFAWVLAVGYLLLFHFRRARVPGRGSGVEDELVKDPVCNTYVVKSRALRWSDASGQLYFCGPECARRHAATR